MTFLENVRILLAAMGLENRLAEMVIADIHVLVEAITDHLAAVDARNKAQQSLALTEIAATFAELAEADDPVIGRKDLRGLAAHLTYTAQSTLVPDFYADDPEEDPGEDTSDPEDSTPAA